MDNREHDLHLSNSASTEEPFFHNKIVSQTSKEKPDTFTGSDWLNLEEAALFLRILSRNGTACKQRLRNLVSQGRIPFYKPFGRLLFKRSELNFVIESSKKGGIKCR